MINKETTLCMSLSGRPSNFGTCFHNSLYEQLNLNFIYKAFTTKDIEAAVKGVRALGIRGCAISMPFKEACIPFLDHLTQSVLAINSVNTIVNDDGVLTAYNTDYIAIQKLIIQHNISTEQSVLIHGSGGMAKAVIAAFYDAGFKRVTLLARNDNEGKKLSAKYDYPWIADINGSYDVLVNTTPIGMSGGNETETLSFAVETIQQAQIVFDVIAMPIETPIIKAAQQQNKKIITGREVMVLQAVEQFVLYTGIKPTDDQILIATNHATALI